MKTDKVDPKGRIVETKSGRFFKVGEQLNTGEIAAAKAFTETDIIKEDEEKTENSED